MWSKRATKPERFFPFLRMGEKSFELWAWLFSFLGRRNIRDRQRLSSNRESCSNNSIKVGSGRGD